MWTIKPSTAQRLIEQGKQDQTCGQYDEMRIYEQYGASCRWELIAYQAGRDIAKGRWRVDFDLTERTWQRIGEPRVDDMTDEYLQSYNSRDDAWEGGMSVIDDDWTQRINYIWWADSIKQRGMWQIKGIQCGWGSDGEPLIIPTGKASRVK